MKKANSILIKSLLLFFIFFVKAESKIISIGNEEAKVKIKVFSSLSCPACANFHSKIFKQLKLDFIDKNLVKFEHHPFPLNFAALNAELILRCHVDKDKKIKLLDKLYKKQGVWAFESDKVKMNNEIKKIGLEIDLNNEKMNNCLENDKFQDEILGHRLEAQKKYKIESTPTILINEKKYNGKIDYKAFKKTLEKYL